MIESWGRRGRGRECSSCSFEAFVSRPVTRTLREQERVTRSTRGRPEGAVRVASRVATSDQ